MVSFKGGNVRRNRVGWETKSLGILSNFYWILDRLVFKTLGVWEDDVVLLVWNRPKVLTFQVDVRQILRNFLLKTFAHRTLLRLRTLDRTLFFVNFKCWYKFRFLLLWSSGGLWLFLTWFFKHSLSAQRSKTHKINKFN